MELVIKGCTKLDGTIKTSGSKNAALPVLAAALLSNEEVILHNVPKLQDVYTMIDVLKSLGVKVIFLDSGTVIINASGCDNYRAPYELVKKMRASFVVLGSLLGRFHKAEVSHPGGCAIGARPVDIHISAMQKLGVDITVEHGYVCARAKKLKGDDVVLGFPSVGATQNVMMAACLAKGTTRIFNAAREPEICDLAGFLNVMGANISGAGTECIVIEGVKELHGCEYTIIPDRIEAGTYILAACALPSDILVTNIDRNHLLSLTSRLSGAGVNIEYTSEGVRVKGTRKIKAVNITSEVYPGFPTDLLPQFMAVMCVADGNALIKETIFENRFMHVAEMMRMGASIQIIDRTASVKGVKALTGAEVTATDLRAGAALAICAILADGPTRISRIYHIDRGYENFEQKLSGINVKIERVARNG